MVTTDDDEQCPDPVPWEGQIIPEVIFAWSGEESKHLHCGIEVTLENYEDICIPIRAKEDGLKETEPQIRELVVFQQVWSSSFSLLWSMQLEASVEVSELSFIMIHIVQLKYE